MPTATPAERDRLDLVALNELTHTFSYRMFEKLRIKHELGVRGWNDLACREGILAALKEHVERGDGQWVDVANLAMMLWNMETVPQQVYDKNGMLTKVGDWRSYEGSTVCVTASLPEGVEIEFPDRTKAVVDPKELDQ